MPLECKRFCLRMSATIWMVVMAGGGDAMAQRAAGIAGGDRVDAVAVQEAIDRGIAYLRSTQNARGGWKEYVGQNGGLSSLCTLAMLTAGVSADDPAIRSALAYLRRLEPTDTYAVSLQTLVFCQVGAPGDLVRIRRNVRWLESEQMRGDGNFDGRLGGWNYGGNRGNGDPSNSQFALLALQAAEERDVPVNPDVYRAADAYWQTRQLESGAWAYTTSSPPMGSMTCAGIASVIICRGHSSGAGSSVQGDRIVCCGEVADARDPVQAGLDWLGERFSVRVNPGSPGSATFYYYLYALERVGRMTGRRFIGGHDWYREGAERLLQLQDGFQGFWAGSGFGEEDRNVTTSFSLLFLAKGKRQVAIGRLRFGEQADRDDGRWHRHSDASRQLVRRLERFWGRDLTWQTVALAGATVEDLLQTPVLMITAEGPLGWSAGESRLLQDYVEQGGTILFEASGGEGCGDTAEAEADIRRVCAEWYPSAPLGPLPPTHSVYFAEADVKPDRIAADYQIQGVQACCRTAIFYSPLSLSCRWELSDPTGRGRVAGQARGQIAPAAADSIEMASRLGQNVIAYATGRELRDKLDGRLVVRPEPIEETSLRGVIELGRLAVDAGAREAQRALPNLAAIAAERIAIRIQASTQELPIEAEALADYPILWIHGRGEFSWDRQQREELRTFLQRGGVILADAICGNPAFAIAFRREIAAILPDSPLRPLPTDHPAFTANFGGFDIRSVTIRTPAGDGMAEVGRRRGGPPIETAEVDSVAAVFFSPLDLSCALESPNSIQCPGYDTTDASKIAINLILYALQQ